MLVNTERSEGEIFKELGELCVSPGYLHAIAYFCFRDNTINYALDEGVSPESFLSQFNEDRLLRNEISVLIGLAVKAPLDLDLPSQMVLQQYIEKTDQILREIHSSMLPKPKSKITQETYLEHMKELVEGGAWLREAIFYGGESAYHFQYRDFCLKKYASDTDFLELKRGFSLVEAYEVVKGLEGVMNHNLMVSMDTMRTKEPDEWTILPAFVFSVSQLSELSHQSHDTVLAVLESFTVRTANLKYEIIDDFNIINACPLIPLENEQYMLFQYYSIVESFYESPFFWFLEDSKYKSTALTHRGGFTETFSIEMLQRVFRAKNVFANVNIDAGSGKIAGEIDVLVLYANRAIIVQAKSKKLTLEARQGNKDKMSADFQMAVQDAYEQGFSCAEFLLQPTKYILVNKNGELIDNSVPLKEVYIMCVVSDHYPALFIQSRQFLNYQETEVIKPPYVGDVFLLDTLTEFLTSPLLFLNYINRRTQYAERIFAASELTVLAHHLNTNLWFDEEDQFMQLADDISVELDMAMSVRRLGLDGPKTPLGILTKYVDTPIGALLTEIEKTEDPNIIDFGFLVLSLNEETIATINQGIEKITELSRSDKKSHDLTLLFTTPDSGLTLHSNFYPYDKAKSLLDSHCRNRKYKPKAAQWHGLCLDPETQAIKFGISYNEPWEFDEHMEQIVSDLPKPQKKLNFKTFRRNRRKVGRNEPCLCGSGKKSKKCCNQ